MNALNSVATDSGLQQMGRSLRFEIREFENRLTNNLTIRMGSMVAFSTALTVIVLGI
jgi:hypothetical protein